MVGAAGGVVLGFAFLRRRSALGLAAAALALGAFALLACAGLAIIARYTMLAAAVLAIFAAARACSAGACWRRSTPGGAPGRPSPPSSPLMFVALAPEPVRPRLAPVTCDLTNQGEIERDLTDLADSGAFEPLCVPISVPNHRAVPRLAFGLDVKPTTIVSSTEQRQPRARLLPRPGQPLRHPQLHPRPQRPGPLHHHRPRRLPSGGAQRSWVLYRHC